MLPVLSQRAMAKSFSRLPKYFKLVEIQKILNEDLRNNYYDEWFLCSFLWHLGVRISEALSILHSDIDYIARNIRIVTLKRKHHERIVPIKPEFLLEIKLYQQYQKEKLTTKKRDLRKVFHYNRATAYEYVRHACVVAGFADDRAHPHSFRHSYAVNCLLHGVPVTKLQQWLGHANLMNTLVYTAIANSEDHTLLREVDFGTTIIPAIVER